jgi:hypothetical protein
MIMFDFFQNGFEKAFLSHLQKRLLRLVCWDRQAAPIGRKECPRACGGRLVTNAGVVPIVKVVVAELAIPFPCPSIVQQDLNARLSRACLGKENHPKFKSSRFVSLRTAAIIAGVQRLRTTAFLSRLYIKTIILPRQARDKHRESTQNRCRFSHLAVKVGWQQRARRSHTPAENVKPRAVKTCGGNASVLS